jgi:hypothetical protein
MGTNYYRIPTEKEIEDRKNRLLSEIRKMDLSPSSVENGFAVTNEDTWDRFSPWDNFIKGTSIHLGKRSMGWKFCWNFHNDKWYSNKEDLLKFIRSGRVVDEYGEEQEVEEFIEMALNWGQPDGLVVNKEYEDNLAKTTGRRRTCFYGPKYWDRIVDGLRVSSSVEFS